MKLSDKVPPFFTKPSVLFDHVVYDFTGTSIQAFPRGWEKKVYIYF